MHKVIIEGRKYEYFKSNELEGDQTDGTLKLYKDTYDNAKLISKHLNIECPDIVLIPALLYSNGTVLGGYSYTPKDDPSLEKPLVLISTVNFKIKEYIGTLAHELRHIWQYTHLPDINEKHANGFTESLNHPAEIDADGYAIYYIAKKFNISISSAATIICPEEKKRYPKEYLSRIKKATEFRHLD